MDAYKGPSIYYTDNYGVRARVVALHEMPHSHYTSEIFLRVTSFLGHIWILFLSCDDWFATVQNIKCSQIEVVFESSHQYLIVDGCGVSLVYKQDWKSSTK